MITDKKVVIVTGVAGGIGHSTAQTFSSAGWYVVGIDRKADEGLDFIDHYIQADAEKPNEIQSAFNIINAEIGALHALVNNAAIQITKPMMEMSIDEWDSIMDVNVRAAFLFSQGAFPHLQISQGSIVNVSSVHAVATSADIAAYATSKGALLALTRALAVELAASNVRVNAILPGAVDTPMLRSGLNRAHVSGTLEQKMQELADKTVIRRVGTPSEISKSILFLADSDQSSFITGQALIVDGGATARLSTE